MQRPGYPVSRAGVSRNRAQQQRVAHSALQVVSALGRQGTAIVNRTRASDAALAIMSAMLFIAALGIEQAFAHEAQCTPVQGPDGGRRTAATASGRESPLQVPCVSLPA